MDVIFPWTTLDLILDFLYKLLTYFVEQDLLKEWIWGWQEWEGDKDESNEGVGDVENAEELDGRNGEDVPAVALDITYGHYCNCYCLVLKRTRTYQGFRFSLGTQVISRKLLICLDGE